MRIWVAAAVACALGCSGPPVATDDEPDAGAEPAPAEADAGEADAAPALPWCPEVCPDEAWIPWPEDEPTSMRCENGGELCAPPPF